MDRRLARRRAAAFAGLTPKEFRSGSSVHRRTKLSKQGNAQLRRALYMPAVAAVRKGRFKEFFIRLVEKGKARKSALGAAMHKLLRVAFAVLKSGRPYMPVGA